MPLIRVNLIEGGVPAVQKRELIAKLTEAFVSVVGEDLRPITWVLIEEIKNGDWGMAGEPCIIDTHSPALGGAR